MSTFRRHMHTPSISKRKLHFGDVVTLFSPFGTHYNNGSLGMVVDMLPSPSRLNSVKVTPEKTLTSFPKRPHHSSKHNQPMYTVLVDQHMCTMHANQLCWQKKLPYKAAKLKLLFSLESDETRRSILFDDVSLYSVTDQHTARRISAFCLSLPGISSLSAVTDGTACIGGNTVAFAREFNSIQSVEIDINRCRMLRSNLRLLLSARQLNRVRVCCADYTEVFSTFTQDIVFLDPPWGGKCYKHKKKVQLRLGHMQLTELCGNLLPHCRYVVVKVPTNFDVDNIARTLKRSVRVVKIAEKVLLVVLSGIV